MSFVDLPTVDASFQVLSVGIVSKTKGLKVKSELAAFQSVVRGAVFLQYMLNVSQFRDDRHDSSHRNKQDEAEEKHVVVCMHTPHSDHEATWQ